MIGAVLRRALPSLAALLATAPVAAQASRPAVAPGPDDRTFAVTHEIPVGAAPHGIRFSADGATAYVAASGANAVDVIDCATMTHVRRVPAGVTPLDLVPTEGPDGAPQWIVTQFRGLELARVDARSGEILETWRIGAGGSLFAPRIVEGLAFVVCLHDDRLVVFDVGAGAVRSTHATGRQPYPCAVTRDGRVAIVPNRRDSTLSIIDVVAGETLDVVRIGSGPRGGALTSDDRLYLAACGDQHSVVYVDVATREVTRLVSTGIGVIPFSVAITPDDRYAFVNNAGEDTVSVLDVAAGRVTQVIEVGAQPIAMRWHPDGTRLLVACEKSETVAVIAPGAPAPRTTTAPASRPASRPHR